ncbi:MAG TPA: Mov34/MPN/PAD-1 family protein [Sandaracinaceae bacterium LLY-WYZ-13_1]|nr:Mov34/MPN/PAD-1 family protein [Sandaracinaceae bacterium LLY-WYZ-13_1]
MSGELPPWTRGDLRIRRDVLEAIEAHALECYPSESCGFVAGPTDDAPLLDEATRETNEADKYHRLDPETFPRTSRTYFKINELRAARAFEAGEKAGRPIKVIYHSHCDAGAYFSDEDAATFAADGQLMWPCAFLVVSVEDGRVRDRKLWVHRPGTDGFDESPLAILDPDRA